MVTQVVSSSLLCKLIRHEKSITVFMGYAYRRWILGVFANIVSKQVASKWKARIFQEYNTKSFTLSGKCLQIDYYATLYQLFNFILAITEIMLVLWSLEVWFEKSFNLFKNHASTAEVILHLRVRTMNSEHCKGTFQGEPIIPQSAWRD